MTEGKKNEIRNILEYFGHNVSRLIRVSYGPYHLKSDMNPGDTMEINFSGPIASKFKKYKADRADVVEVK